MEAPPPTKKPTGAEAIKSALAQVPLTPGVYLMKDARGRVIYVGKAKRLKNRLTSYTRQEKTPTWHGHKVQAMVSQVAAVEFVVTFNEKEALLLEDTLIKKHHPRYNVDLRDDKNYPLFRLSLQHDFPRLSLVRKPAADGARYFGPFAGAGAARQTMRLLQRIFPLRRCSDHTLKNRTRPCLDFDMGRCAAPCTGRISPEEYQSLVRHLEAFFRGKGQEVAAELKRRMAEAAAAERYEEAAVFRDRLSALERTLERQQVAKAEAEDLDAWALHEAEDCLRLALLQVRSGRVVASRVHELKEAALPPDEALAQALVSLYGPGNPPPPLVLLSHMPPDPSVLAEVLAERAGRPVELRRPQRGEKRGLMAMALMNAAQPRQEQGPDTGRILARLGQKLGLAEAPDLIECVDISHFGGSLTVASMVAMRGGDFYKDGYRRYKILSTIGAPDDYAAMAEVVGRRLKGDRPPPDLLLLDGGKGQLGVALEVVKGVAPEMRPALAALAKGQEGLPDRLYLPGRKNPVNFPPRDPGLLLLMRLRDEAHRFALAYHRLLRKKAFTRSILEEIPGVGPKRRQSLLKAFGSLAALRKAGAEEMAAKGGLDLAAAQRVARFLASLDSPQPPK